MFVPGVAGHQIVVLSATYLSKTSENVDLPNLLKSYPRNMVTELDSGRLLGCVAALHQIRVLPCKFGVCTPVYQIVWKKI